MASSNETQTTGRPSAVAFRARKAVENLRLSGVATDVTTLGPGPATVIWSQGCTIECSGCMSRETWSRNGGATAAISDVQEWLESQPTRLLTVSGGEPTEQAEGFLGLFRSLRDTGEWLITVYSGRDLSDLHSHGSASIKELLGHVDLLIAGPYVPARHASLLWRGSENQVIHNLSGRIELPPDESVGLSVRILPSTLGIETIGVPQRPGYLASVRKAAANNGIWFPRDNPTSPGVVEFPFPVTDL
jgi:anaerobic ribonucleoside-triphosphate reductase activating protein